MPRRPFLLRIDERVLTDIQRWADDDLRSLNAQIEWLLRRALVASGRRNTEVAETTSKSEDV
jgi:hypothetical protein